MNLPKFSVNKPVTITMMTLIVMVFGLISYSRLGLDMLPDIEYPVVSVVTAYNGAGSEDIEEMVTKPLEEVVATVKDVKEISSISQESMSAVMIEFNDGTNLDFAAQDVRDKIDLVADYLPDGSNQPIVLKMDVGAMPIMAYGITSDSIGSLDLKKTIEDNVKEIVERVDGVASVQLRGGQEREILVKLNKPQLEAYGLNQKLVAQILAGENVPKENIQV
jgi:HAE1 family hydrophobic/amphiphilic exporter-1